MTAFISQLPLFLQQPGITSSFWTAPGLVTQELHWLCLQGEHSRAALGSSQSDLGVTSHWPAAVQRDWQLLVQMSREPALTAAQLNNLVCKIGSQSLYKNLTNYRSLLLNEELQGIIYFHTLFLRMSRFKQKVLMINDNINIAVDLHRPLHF